MRTIWFGNLVATTGWQWEKSFDGVRCFSPHKFFLSIDFETLEAAASHAGSVQTPLKRADQSVVVDEARVRKVGAVRRRHPQLALDFVSL
jgi:hypothetical protein